jgi:membrane fusion protein, multidrug efflux system
MLVYSAAMLSRRPVRRDAPSMPMPLTAYAATLRALESERRGGRVATLLAAGALLAAWVAWSLGAEVAVSAESVAATIAPAAAVRVLTAPAEGILASRRLELGQRVRAGELLATIDSREQRVRLAALDERRAALDVEAAAIVAQQAAVRRALAEERSAEIDAAGERRQRAGEAAAAAAAAEEVRSRDAALVAAGLLARAVAARSRAEAEQRERAAAAAGLAAEAGTRRGRAALADRGAADSRLAGELSRLHGELAALAGERDAVARDLARRSLRAPVAGRLAEVTAPPPGALVARGAALAVLVPDSPLTVVAGFEPPGGPRIQGGQRARVRLPAGPGFTAVALPATVIAVAPAPGRGGSWEVHLTILGDAAARSPLVRPGGPCRVEVEIARDTPAGLVLAALGRGARAPAGGEAAP